MANLLCSQCLVSKYTLYIDEELLVVLNANFLANQLMITVFICFVSMMIICNFHDALQIARATSTTTATATFFSLTFYRYFTFSSHLLLLSTSLSLSTPPPPPLALSALIVSLFSFLFSSLLFYLSNSFHVLVRYK